MWTVADILPEIARHLDGTGVCLDSQAGVTRALEEYNRICEELMADDSWDGATAEVEFGVVDDYFSLPSHFETLVACTLANRPSPVRPGGWRYLQQAPLLANGTGLSEVRDLGDHFATARDLPEPMQIMVYSDLPEAGTAHLVLHGTSPDGTTISRGGLGMLRDLGERIAIVGAAFQPDGGSRAQPLLTRAVFDRRPSMVTKTPTNGSVTLAGYVAGKEPVWLSTYRPDETRPSYRRYGLSITPTTELRVIARVRLRFVPALSTAERAMIQFRPPFGIYAQALAARDAGRFDDYQRYRNSALAKLKRQREVKIESQTHTPSFASPRAGSSIATARRR